MITNMILSLMLWFNILLLSMLPTIITSHRGKNETWYTRYPSYPEYCSTPEMMERRSIPALSPPANGIRGDSRLVHVTAIIRHGARTPVSRSDEDCWDGYWTNGATSIWNCDLTTFLSPPSPLKVEEEEGWTPAGSDAMFLFEKKYDALKDPLSNEIVGTCQAGQLLLQGYEQELANGEHLRNAYVYDSSNMDHDSRMRLLDLSDDKSLPYQEPVIRYRADDDQRTLMSGQVLLRGMFGTEFVQHIKNTGTRPVIPVHTADRWRDVLDANHDTCPKLATMRKQAESSKGYKSLLHTKEAREVQNYMKENLGGPHVMQNQALDCIMTTICTDRPLPDAIADFGTIGPRSLHGDDDDDEHEDEHHGDDGSSSSSDDGITARSWFERIQEFDISKYSYRIRYKDSQHAKLGTAPLWAEIMEMIEPAVGVSARPPENKLALFAGHDTTIMPLMETLGIWDGITWPPYASMLIIEMHELIDGQTDRTIYKSDYAFRILFNGKVLTDKMKNCPQGEELCDVQILLDRIAPFATRSPDCGKASLDGIDDNVGAMTESKQLLSTPGGIVLVLFVLFLTATLSSIATYYHITKTMPWSDRRRSAYMKATYDLELTEQEHDGSNNVNSSSSSSNGLRRPYRDNPDDEEEEEDDNDQGEQAVICFT